MYTSRGLIKLVYKEPCSTDLKGIKHLYKLKNITETNQNVFQVLKKNLILKLIWVWFVETDMSLELTLNIILLFYLDLLQIYQQKQLRMMTVLV